MSFDQIDTAGPGKPNNLRAKFFRDDARDYIEISIIGDPNTVLRKVTPEDVARFSRDWEAYQSGQVEVPIEGLPLTDVPGVDRQASLALKLKGVRTVEELAGLDEGAAKALGMGGLTFWNAAKLVLRNRQLEAMAASFDAAPKRRRTEEAA